VPSSRIVEPIDVFEDGQFHRVCESGGREYVAEQIISFRKLMEKGARDPKKQVISLRRLIDDVKNNRHLLTRERCSSAMTAYHSMIEAGWMIFLHRTKKVSRLRGSIQLGLAPLECHSTCTSLSIE